MSFGTRLKERREFLGLSRSGLALKLGVTASAIGNYENGVSSPKLDILYKIFSVLDVEPNYLWQDDFQTSSGLFVVSFPEQAYIKKYRILDDHGKKMVNMVLEEEYSRYIDEKKINTPKIVELFPTRHYYQPASAGYGDFNDDNSYEIIDLVKRPPNGTSFIITVHGDSMEPTYKDGDLLFVRTQNQLNIGDIGIVTIGADLFVKEFGQEGLISHNPNYAPPEILEDTPVTIQGKVLGVCTNDYLR